MHRRTNLTGINIIKKFEGFRQRVYNCPSGYPTIGFGHKILPSEKFTIISYNMAQSLLYHDLDITEQIVLRYIKSTLNNNQFSALVSLTFNIGGAALQRSTLRQKINYEQYEDAGLEFLRWIYTKNKMLSGLVKRRREEYHLFML